jgi:hydroxyethylthiazole kinase-like uncharacterized protein yjeF
MKLVTTTQMRELERRTIEEFNTKGETLMDRAGEGVYSVVRRMAEVCGFSNPLVHLIAGRGNNGGDAFVAARLLKAQGCEVEIWLAGSDNQVHGDALLQMSRMKVAGIPLRELPTPESWQDAMHMPVFADIIVDGVLGTGITGPARGPAAGAIRYINAQSQDAIVLSIDIPSGLNADTGEAEGDVVVADMTITMGLPKTGLVEAAALEYVGSIEVVDIGIPLDYVEEIDSVADKELIHLTDIRSLFKRRKRASHKGSYGHVLLIGGSRGMAGSIAMAARTALRSGAGLVSVLVPESIAPLVQVACVECIVHAGEENAEGGLAFTNWNAWRNRVDTYDAILIGPGLMTGGDALNLVRNLVRECEKPLVVDADAIMVMKGQADYFNKARRPAILTPHPGEMAKLLHKDIADIQGDRYSVARSTAVETRAVVVLKGGGTVVARKDGPVHVNLTGNPGMATAGSGDVLAGLVTGLLGQGFDSFDAARAGVYLHGRAGDLGAWRKCQAALVAGDIIEEIPFAFREVTLR